MPGEHINFLLDFPAEMMGWGVSSFNRLLKSKDILQACEASLYTPIPNRTMNDVPGKPPSTDECNTDTLLL